jgi:hypothetical protein
MKDGQQHLRLVFSADGETAKGTIEAISEEKSSGGGGGDMEARIAKLEASVEHIQTDISEIKLDIREIRKEFSASLDKVDSRFDKVDSRFDGIQKDMTGLVMWAFGAITATLLTGLGIIVALYELLKPTTH